MPRTFTITTPAETIPVAEDGRAEIVFTVANTSGVPNRAMARIVTLGDTRAEWLRINGEIDHDFPTDGTFPFNVVAQIPPGTRAGRYPFHLDVVSARKGGEDYIEGPTIALQAAERPIVRKSRWPWIVAIVAALAVSAVVAVLVWRRPQPIPERQRVENVAAAWYAGFRDGDAAAVVALTEVPFYWGGSLILPQKSDVERSVKMFHAASQGADKMDLRRMDAKTIAEWKAQGADPRRDPIVSSLSMADTDWRADLDLGTAGESQTKKFVLFIRLIDGEPKVVGISD